MKPSSGGLVMLKTKSCLGVSSSSASRVAVESGVRMNWSTSRINMDIKDSLGGWLGIAPNIRTGIHACSDYGTLQKRKGDQQIGNIILD